MPSTIICLGDVMTDVVARLRGPLVRGSDSPAPVMLTAGGAAANTACWLAVSGSAAVVVGRIGWDLAGDAALAALTRAGVTAHLSRDPLRPTGTCIVLVSPDGERTMVPDAGANAGLRPKDVPEELFTRTAHLHLSGYSLLNEGSREAALHAVELARRSGATVSVDPASAGPLSAVGAQTFLEWVGGADALLANADEALALTGVSDPAKAARILSTAFTEVIVKLGADGALWAGRGSDTVVRVPAEPVEVVDTTGAGDAFAAGWLPVALAGGRPKRALKAGCAVAAQAVTRLGARPA
ncbi:MAG TPA: sugar kinase [Candidatus Limnocylindria bacterium]|nr:sugar kinase [Candidatus Limnocylindria bacterium]